MRAVPSAISAKLIEGVATLAHVWLVTRRDEQVFAFTDHDRALVFQSHACEPSAALTPGAIEKSTGLGVDTASSSGALSSVAIDEAELARGLWDGARVDIYRVDWSDPTLYVHLFAGRIGEVRRGASAFEAELRGLQAPLNKAVGRVFSRFCDADLGDTRCGKNIETGAFRGTGAVTELLGGASFRASGLSAFAQDWFARGRLVWAAGGESEVATHRLEAGGAVIELLEAPGDVLTLAAGFTVYAGCDKRFETCRAKFANGVNFRGFPHMPGNDVIQSGPMAGQPMDGGSRLS